MRTTNAQLQIQLYLRDTFTLFASACVCGCGYGCYYCCCCCHFRRQIFPLYSRFFSTCKVIKNGYTELFQMCGLTPRRISISLNSPIDLAQSIFYNLAWGILLWHSHNLSFLYLFYLLHFFWKSFTILLRA